MRRASLAAASVLAASFLVARQEAPAPEIPAESGIVETTESRLAQIDVSVSGPPEVLATLTRSDFEVSVNRRKVPDFFLDVSCLEPVEPVQSVESPGAGAAADEPSAAPPAPRPRGASYLIYFDQAHLTQGGRQVSMDLAREIVPKLVTGASRAMIVSNAEALTTVVPLTSDAKVLVDALAKLKNDNSQWDPYPTLEDGRLAEVQDEILEDIDRAISIARRYQAEDRWRQEKALRRLSMVLGTFAALDPPKAVLYFADTMRQNAGEHYMSFFGATVIADQAATAAAAAELDAGTGALPLDRVINEAGANGIRFYTIEGQGLMAPSIATEARHSARTFANSGTPDMNSVRFRDAENTLTSLAMETGGQMFLSGAGPGKISDRILRDISCVYLLSFDPKDLPEDTALPVTVKVSKPRVKVQARGRIVIQSASARLTSRLLAAFAAPEASRSDVPLRIGVVPIGYRDGGFSALVQVGVAGLALADSSWDLGASLVSEGQVREDGSGHVRVKAAGTPVVYEKEMTFRPGPYQIVGVAHETTSNLVSSHEVEGAWPDLKSSLAMLGPIAILQPSSGAFLRAKTVHTSGTLAVPEREPVAGDAPLAVVGIVCRSKDQKGSLRVERRIVGDSEAPFPPLDLQLGSERCAQFRDVVKAKSLSPGDFRFEVRVLDHGVEVAKAGRAFSVAGSGS
jgi:VWFA-related protein